MLLTEPQRQVNRHQKIDMCDVPDSLEGWVAVKEQPFHNVSTTKTRLEFHVAWNEHVGKIVLTCREHSRVASDSTPSGQCGGFTFNEIKAIHEQLCLIHPSLGPYLPELPLEPQGLWAYFYNQEQPSNDLCSQLQSYFKTALDIVGQSLFLSTLFEEHTYEEYFEKISELKRRVYDEAVAAAKDQLESVLFLRSGSINMLDMVENYKLEDDSLYKLNLALAELYNYLLQPFVDMREVACEKLKEAKHGLQNQDYGARRKAEFAVMFAEWQENYEHALDSIQQFYIEYYNKTVDILTNVKKRMSDDQKKFGKNTFEMNVLERLHRVTEDLHLEKLQLLQHTKKQYENQRDKVKQQIVSLEEKPNGVKKEAEEFEQQVYDWQVKVLDAHMELLEEESRLIKHRILVISHQLSANETEEFYDTVEDPEDLSSDDEDAEPMSMMIGGRLQRRYGGKMAKSTEDPRIVSLKNKMAAIHKKKAQIRNKLSKLVRDKGSKEKKKVAEVDSYVRHHNIQLKRDEQKAEMVKKKEFYDQERKKTLDRLRKHKMKCPSASTLKPWQRRTSSQSRPSSGDSKQCPRTPRGKKAGDNPDGATGEHLPAVVEVKDGEFLEDTVAALPPAVPPPPPPPLPPPPPPPLPPPSLPAVLNLDIPKESGKQGKSDTKKPLKEQSEQRDHVMDMVELIKKGVKLKSVKPDESRTSFSGPPSNEHIRELQTVLLRMKDKMNPSDDEDSGDVEDSEGFLDD